MMERHIIYSFVWKLLERGGYVGIQFVVQIVLARLIAPEQFGVLAIMTSFINFVQVFSQSGLNSALIQSNKVIEEDYSSVFIVNFCIMAVFFVLLYFAAPFIAAFYAYDNFVKPFRLMCLNFFVTALSAVQIAILTKQLRFKAIFKCSITGVVVSGVVGVTMAYMGFGIWALVIHTLLNHVINTVCLSFAAKWRPRLMCSVSRIRMLLSYGGKVLAGSLVGEIYNDICSFVIGKVAPASSLAFFNRGKIFPQNVYSIVTTSTKSVMYPVMSKQQDSDMILITFRKTMRMSAYIVTPMLAGMAAVAEPMVLVLLTEKWLEAAPYLQVFCAVYIVYQIHGIYTTALNSKGRSDLTLKVQATMVGLTLLLCIASLLVFKSTLLVAWSTLLVAIVPVIPMNAIYCRRVLGYRLREQISDILPSLILTAVMYAGVWAIGLVNTAPLLKLLCQLATGIALYIIISLVSNNSEFRLLLSYIKGRKKA